MNLYSGRGVAKSEVVEELETALAQFAGISDELGGEVEKHCGSNTGKERLGVGAVSS